MIVERLAAAAFLLHDAGARPSVGERPVDNPVLEQVVKQIVEVVGEGLAATAGGQAADAVEDLPDSDGGKSEPLVRDRVQKRGGAGSSIPCRSPK